MKKLTKKQTKKPTKSAYTRKTKFDAEVTKIVNNAIEQIRQMSSLRRKEAALLTASKTLSRLAVESMHAQRTPMKAVADVSNRAATWATKFVDTSLAQHM